jgi:hypothetical protein
MSPNVDKPLSGIDEQMYRIAQKKDISFKKIEVIMRSAAFDCALTYKRNQVIGQPNTRICNYTNCDYKCIGIPEIEYKESSGLSLNSLDYSTYDLYYSQDKIQQLVDAIVELFRTNFILSFRNISDKILSNNEFELLTALDRIISNSVQIYNRDGCTSYLQTKETFDTIKEKYFSDVALPRVIKDLSNSKEIRVHLERLPLKYKKIVLENSVKAEILRERGRQFQPDKIELVNKIIKYFESSIRKVGDNLIVSILEYTELGVLRCLNITGNDTDLNSLRWKDCSEKEEEEYLENDISIRKKMEKKPFYGQINPIKNKFCIRDCRDGKCDEQLLGHRKTSGVQCFNGYNRWTLALIATFYTEMPVPPTPKTLEYVLGNSCGSPLSRSKVARIQRGLVDDNIVVGLGTTNIKIPYNSKEDISTFLINLVDNVENFKKTGIDNIEPKVAKHWFDNPEKDLFQYLVKLGGKDINKGQWDALKAGIRKMSLVELQRILFYGTMQKKTLCAFFCSWFNDNNLILIDHECGSGTKYKPKSKVVTKDKGKGKGKGKGKAKKYP